MKVVLFAGGKGTRISEESYLRPKPMIEIGGKPILWHIMKMYAAYGHNEFIVCCGYKGWMIKEYFVNYFLHNSDLTVDIGNNNIEIHRSNSENSSCRTVCIPLRKFLAASILSNSSRGSGAPVSTCAVICCTTLHSQQ